MRLHLRNNLEEKSRSQLDEIRDPEFRKGLNLLQFFEDLNRIRVNKIYEVKQRTKEVVSAQIIPEGCNPSKGPTCEIQAAPTGTTKDTACESPGEMRLLCAESKRSSLFETKSRLSALPRRRRNQDSRKMVSGSGEVKGDG